MTSDLRLGWVLFRVWTALTGMWWLLAFTVLPDAVNPAIAFSLFWVLGLPVLVHASMHQSEENT